MGYNSCARHFSEVAEVAPVRLRTAAIGHGITQTRQALGNSDMEGRNFTFCVLVSGFLVGVLVNVSNTYYGLRVGAGSYMSMVFGLLGYVGFKLFSKYTPT